MKRILESTDKLTQGDLSVRIKPFHGFDSMNEFDVIIENLNKMAEELSSIETLRTDFIANHLYQTALQHVTRTPEEWTTFMRSACRNYKCRFDEQVLIYAQQENTKDTPADKSAQDFEAFLNEKFAGTMDVKEVPKSEQPNSENPTLAAKSPPQHLSKNSSEKAEHGGMNSDSRPSIRGELKNIKEEIRINPDKSPRGKSKGSKQKTSGAKNKPPKQKPKAR